MKVSYVQSIYFVPYKVLASNILDVFFCISFLSIYIMFFFFGFFFFGEEVYFMKAGCNINSFMNFSEKIDDYELFA